VDKPITSTRGKAVLFCARCGYAHTRAEAILRRFNTGYSACCNENLMPQRPRNRCAPKQYSPLNTSGQPGAEQ
jgi:hypothetical protein